MGDATQESGEPRLQFTTSFYTICRSEVGSDSSEVVERGVAAVKQWSDGREVVEGGATAPLHGELRATGWRPLSTVGDAAQESGEPRLQFTISFCAVRRNKAGSDRSKAVKRGAMVAKQQSFGAMAVKQ